ncbi:MAG: hypothetical protein LIO57_06105 [Oscillospiraceae bacterium]|nr:hypothetical protein [Oscillospiraceae bacterium]
MSTKIKQGDAYSLPVALTLNGSALSGESVETAEFCLGRSLRKLYPQEVTFSADDGCFYIPLSQEETFALPPEAAPLDVRVKFPDGQVMGAKAPGYIQVVCALSREEL